MQLGSDPLSHYIFKTLLSVHLIDDVYVFCSDPRLLGFLPEGVKWLPRNADLDSDDTKANELFRAAVESVSHEIIVLAQAPGPFVKRESIIRAVESIQNEGFDCAATVTRHQTYAWFEEKPLNYDPKKIEQTQNIESVFLETSGLYAFTNAGYRLNGSRIFGKINKIEVDKIEAIDIDEPSDFLFAQQHLAARGMEFLTAQSNAMLDDIRNLGKLNHLCFDLDGVLIDSLDVMESSWNFAMRDFNLRIGFESYKKEIGLPFKMILEKLGVPLDLWEKVEHLYSEKSSELIDKILPYEGVHEGLTALSNAGYKLSLFTSKSKLRTEQILQKYFYGVFQCVVTPEDLSHGRGKPSPDGILMACLKNQSSPTETLYVGDMNVDFEAASAAGVNFVFAGWGYGPEDLRSKVWFDSFAGFAKWLSK